MNVSFINDNTLGDPSGEHLFNLIPQQGGTSYRIFGNKEDNISKIKEIVAKKFDKKVEQIFFQSNRQGILANERDVKNLAGDKIYLIIKSKNLE